MNVPGSGRQKRGREESHMNRLLGSVLLKRIAGFAALVRPRDESIPNHLITSAGECAFNLSTSVSVSVISRWTLQIQTLSVGGIEITEADFKVITYIILPGRKTEIRLYPIQSLPVGL